MFLGRDRAAVSVDVDAERCWPRYHETSLALESTDSRWHMQKQQPQGLEMNATGMSAVTPQST